ncbi:CBO0543 family protein [Aquibacillus kalidii]|uniref:CBO0543 family protein n=1 Tax=Aquibacillus kalidii TaxID=2762597 RepID=UPI0016472D99|nr:CBO0543 family protein [Aquibacillus kalidii]
MHVFISILVISAVWLKGDWKHWEKYHSVMLYFAIGNLTYNFLTANHFLWRIDPDFLFNHTLTEMIYTFIIFPGCALLFIGNFPKGRSKVVKHYAFWLIVFIVGEYLLTLTDHIKYQYGWHLGWSALFDCIMFPMMKLFYHRPLLAYIISIPLAIFFIWYFDVPVHLPVEDR